MDYLLIIGFGGQFGRQRQKWLHSFQYKLIGVISTSTLKYFLSLLYA